MAGPNWRTNPDIQLAKQVCQQKQAKAAILVWFTPKDVGGASYGVNGRICKEAGDVLDQIVDAINTSGYIDIVGLSGAMEK